MLPSPGPTVSTGVSGLDNILKGGLPQSRMHVLQGAPGTGKTTLALQFLLKGVEANETCLYITLSETQSEVDAVATAHGWSLEGIRFRVQSPAQNSIDAENRTSLFDPAEVELMEAIESITVLIDELKPTRLVFDSIAEMRLLAGDAFRFRRQILELKHFLADRGCTSLFVDDHSADGVEAHLQSLAHGVISLTHVAPEYGNARQNLEIKKMRGVGFRSGKHDYVIDQGGMQVFPRLIASEHRQPFERRQLRSAVAPLDSLLGGGLDYGTSILFVGPAGCGKSTVSGQYVRAALRRGERVACFNFDENVATFFARYKGTGIDVESYAGNLLHVEQVDPGQLSPGEFIHRVRRSVEEHQARVVVIDSLNGYLNAMPNERFLVVQMHELLTYLSQLGCISVLVVAQHGMIGQMQTPIDVTYLADSVILFRFFEAQGRFRRAISVLKKRVGIHEDNIREFQIGAAGLVVGAPLTDFRGILSGTPVFLGTNEGLLTKQT